MRMLSLTASALALVAASPALAQTGSRTDVPVSDAQGADETIIVTAPGRARSSAELIASTTAIGRAELVESLAPTLGDTLDRQPGVASSSFGQGASRPILRGLGAERVLVLTNGIGVIDASAASPDHQVTADGIDATRVEIVRGPAALAYGGQAIGGVVNVLDGLIAPRAPAGGRSAEALAAWNSVSEGSELALRGSAGFGPVVATVSASQRDLGDYAIPGFAESDRLIAAEGDEHDAEDAIRDRLPNSFVETASFGFGLTWAGPRGYLGLAWREQTAVYGLPGHGHEHHDHGAMAPVAAAAEEEEAPVIDLEQTRTELRGRLDLGTGPVTALEAGLVLADYVHSEAESRDGPPGTLFVSDGWEGRIDAVTSIAGWSGEIGIAARDSTLAASGDEAFLTSTETTSAGLFVYQEREWDNGFGIEGGARFEQVELVNEGGGTRNFDVASASLGAHRHLGEAWFLGAQLSWTERAPKEFELFANGPHLATEQYELGDRTLAAERGLSFDLTARYTAGRAQAGVSLYAIDFADFIYLSPGTVTIGGVALDEVDGLPVFQFRQTGASFQGGEITIDWRPDPAVWGAQWTLGAGLDWVTGSLDGGRDVPFLPPVTLNLDATADWQRLRLGAHLSLAGEQSDPGEGYLETDGYAALDLTASWALDADARSRLFLDARNVTDEEIRLSTSVLKDLVPSPGRNIRIGVRWVL
jgi:iron complex outermembrane recepter protein